MTMLDPSHGWGEWTLRATSLVVRRGKRTVLQGVDFAIRRGECVCLIGPNGAGKTSLLLTLLGVLHPESGTLALDSRPLASLSSRQRGRFCSYVPQGVDRLPDLTVRDVVEGGRYPYVSPLAPFSPEDRRCVEAALAACGLTDLSQRLASAISAGERQKTLLAAALAQDAQLMCLDEPNTALDPAVQVELLDLLAAWRDRGRSVLLVSHDLHFPTVLGGRVVALRDGRIAADGPAGEVLECSRLAAIFGADFQVASAEDGRRLVVPRWRTK